MKVAARGVIRSAKVTGTVDYMADPDAAKQFDAELNRLMANPAFQGMSSEALAQAAHVRVIALRGAVAERAGAAVATKGQGDADVECKIKQGETPSVRRDRLKGARLAYPQWAERGDAALVEELHREFYSDLPVRCVAEALGIEVPADAGTK